MSSDEKVNNNFMRRAGGIEDEKHYKRALKNFIGSDG